MNLKDCFSVIILWISGAVLLIMIGIPGEASAILSVIIVICIGFYLAFKDTGFQGSSNTSTIEDTQSAPPKCGSHSLSKAHRNADLFEELSNVIDKYRSLSNQIENLQVEQKLINSYKNKPFFKSKQKYIDEMEPRLDEIINTISEFKDQQKSLRLVIAEENSSAFATLHHEYSKWNHL